MAQRATIAIYFPQKYRGDNHPLERLEKMARERDRSVNYLAVQAILEDLEREEDK